MVIIIFQALYIWLSVASAQTKLSTEEVQRVTIKLPHGGSLEGTRWKINGNNSVDAYLGIPFAKPPVGDLRFAPPQPVDPWTGTRDATKLCKACMQYIFGSFDNANKAAKIWVNNTEMDEDCLYLNVWTPATNSRSLKPVMIWIFGGGYFSGTPNLDVYDGRFLVAMEDVVVVSMNYRLGPFGFLYLKSHVEGNMGLKDQQLSLKWVKDNIATFNGDPNLITVFGESAGSVSVGLQYLNPTSRSYFKRFILESAGPFNRWSISTSADAHETGIAFIKASGCSDDKGDLEKEIKCLRGLPAYTLFDRLTDVATAAADRRRARLKSMYKTSQFEDSFLLDAAQYFDIYMRPVIDGDFIPGCPSTILKSIQRDDAPDVLIGSVDKEGIFWLLYGLGLKGITFLQDDGGVTLPTLEQLKKLKIDYLKLIETRFTSIGQLVVPFPAITALEYGYNSPEIPDMTYHNTDISMNDITSTLHFMYKLDDLSGELDFVCGTLLFARLLSNIPNSKVQYFNFMHKTNGSQFPSWTGLMHGYEIEYVFGMPFSEPFTSQYYKFTQEEEELSKRVMKYWANFARTGQASPKVEEWPLFNST
ncbi:unnamed protein product, partial [Hymenolepis diminuta]